MRCAADACAVCLCVMRACSLFLVARMFECLAAAASNAAAPPVCVCSEPNEPTVHGLQVLQRMPKGRLRSVVQVERGRLLERQQVRSHRWVGGWGGWVGGFPIGGGGQRTSLAAVVNGFVSSRQTEPNRSGDWNTAQCAHADRRVGSLPFFRLNFFMHSGPMPTIA